MPKIFGRLAAILFFLAAASCFVTAVAGSSEEWIPRMISRGVFVGLAGAILFFDASVEVIERADPKIGTKEEAHHSILDNVEVHNKRSLTKNPEIEFYITVEEKAQNE